MLPFLACEVLRLKSIERSAIKAVGAGRAERSGRGTPQEKGTGFLACPCRSRDTCRMTFPRR